MAGGDNGRPLADRGKEMVIASLQNWKSIGEAADDDESALIIIKGKHSSRALSSRPHCLRSAFEAIAGGPPASLAENFVWRSSKRRSRPSIGNVMTGDQYKGCIRRFRYKV
jgi:hypothetical protein